LENIFQNLGESFAPGIPGAKLSSERRLGKFGNISQISLEKPRCGDPRIGYSRKDLEEYGKIFLELSEGSAAGIPAAELSPGGTS
jgi:hypothetical protein